MTIKESDVSEGVEQRARELLAAEFEAVGNTQAVAILRAGDPGETLPYQGVMLSAIVKALSPPLPSPGVERLTKALRQMVYETTHLSPCEVDGSHRCTISGEALEQARAALSALPLDGGGVMQIDLGLGKFLVSAAAGEDPPTIHFYRRDHGAEVGTVMDPDADLGEPAASIVIHNLEALACLSVACDHLAACFAVPVDADSAPA